MIRLFGVAFTVSLLASACAHETQGDLSVFSEEVTSEGGTGGASGGQGGSVAKAPNGGNSSSSGSTSAPTAGTFGTPGGQSGATFGGSPGSAGTFGMPASGTGGGGTGAGAGGKAGNGGGGGGGAGGTPPVGGQPCKTGKLTATAATASSSEDAGALGPASAIDGNMGTRWSSAHSEPQWLALDLGKAGHVSRVVVRWEAAYATSYRVEIANNANGPWTELFADDAGNGGNDDVDDFDAENGRYVRLFGVTRATMYGFSVFEMELYGDADATCK